MPKNPHPLTHTHVKLAALLLLLAFLAQALLVTPPVVTATSRFSCAIGVSGGTTRTISCGSSAGNFVYACTGGSCVDETGTSGGFNQDMANTLCAQYEAEGCPGILTGTPISPESGPVN